MMRSVSEVIRSRRSVNRFVPDECPPAELIREAIEHAVWAPNHHLSQPWRFYLLGRQTAERICLCNAELVRAHQGDKAVEIKLRRWRAVPGWLLLTCVESTDELRRREDFAACCCAAQNMMLFLWDHGVGVKWTTGQVTRDDGFYDIVGISREEEKVVGLFWYGVPDEAPVSTRRPAETVIFERP